MKLPVLALATALSLIATTAFADPAQNGPWLTALSLTNPFYYGSADATGPAARFFYPSGIARDGAGNLFDAVTGFGFSFTSRPVAGDKLK